MDESPCEAQCHLNKALEWSKTRDIVSSAFLLFTYQRSHCWLLICRLLNLQSLIYQVLMYTLNMCSFMSCCVDRFRIQAWFCFMMCASMCFRHRILWITGGRGGLRRADASSAQASSLARPPARSLLFLSSSLLLPLLQLLLLFSTFVSLLCLDYKSNILQSASFLVSVRL